MAKRSKEDPYRKVRRAIPPPGTIFGSNKHNRSKKLDKIIITQGIEEYYNEKDSVESTKLKGEE